MANEHTHIHGEGPPYVGGYDDACSDEHFRSAVKALFTRKQHGHMAIYLYQGRGAELYDRITNSRNHPTHDETPHLRRNAPSIADLIRQLENGPKPPQTLISIGPGPADSIEQKELELARHMTGIKKVKFIELSKEFNAAAQTVFEKQFGAENVEGFCDDYTNEDLDIGETADPIVVSFGSLLSNVANAAFDRFPSSEMANQLRHFRRFAGNNGVIIIGYDANNVESILKRAYSTPLNGEFIKEFLKRVPDICADPDNFDPTKFNHEVEWFGDAHHLSHKIVSIGYQRFVIDGQQIEINEGDSFEVISSVKPAVQKITDIADGVGLHTENVYQDRNGLAIHVFSIKPRQQQAPSYRTPRPS